jgi:hypothetical protein
LTAEDENILTLYAGVSVFTIHQQSLKMIFDEAINGSLSKATENRINKDPAYGPNHLLASLGTNLRTTRFYGDEGPKLAGEAGGVGPAYKSCCVYLGMSCNTFDSAGKLLKASSRWGSSFPQGDGDGKMINLGVEIVPMLTLPEGFDRSHPALNISRLIEMREADPQSRLSGWLQGLRLQLNKGPWFACTENRRGWGGVWPIIFQDDVDIYNFDFWSARLSLNKDPAYDPNYVGKSWNKPEDNPFLRGGGSQACGRSGRGGARLQVVYGNLSLINTVNWPQKRQWLSLRPTEVVGIPRRDRDLRARGNRGVGPIQFEDDESSFKNGKKIGSLKPGGSSNCKVCDGAEIFRDDVEVYNFDFWNDRHNASCR